MFDAAAAWEISQHKNIRIWYLEAYFQNRRYSYEPFASSVFPQKWNETFLTGGWCEWTMFQLYTIFPIRFNSFSDDSNLIICFSFLESIWHGGRISSLAPSSSLSLSSILFYRNWYALIEDRRSHSQKPNRVIDVIEDSCYYTISSRTHAR